MLKLFELVVVRGVVVGCGGDVLLSDLVVALLLVGTGLVGRVGVVPGVLGGVGVFRGTVRPVRFVPVFFVSFLVAFWLVAAFWLLL